MWNWLVSGLAAGATLLLYDGSPFHPDGNVLFDFAAGRADDLLRHLGEISSTPCARPGSRRSQTHDLSTRAHDRLDRLAAVAGELRLRLSTAIKPDVHLASISGGTDIVSCFVLGDPTEPVWRGEIQGAGPRHGGRCLGRGRQAGRAARRANWSAPRPFPSMPVGFWNDPDGKKYHAAYFERFADVWCHGDFAEWTEHGGMIIHGRSDATLNPGGVRIGTAEIYSAGRADAGGARGDRASARIGTTTCASCCSCGWPPGVALDDELREAHQDARSAPAPARATCRRRSSRSPTSRAPSPARSPSSPCATSCMAAPSRTRRRSPIPRRWSCSGT